MKAKEKKQLHLEVSHYLHSTIRQEAAKREISITQLVIQAVLEHITNHKK
jgi:predicted HicB family RNase H-like nuclease